jgi:hypothetical protein
VITLRPEPIDEAGFLGETVAVAEVGSVVGDLGAFLRGESHAEVVRVSGEDGEGALEFAEFDDADGSEEGFHPTDDVQDVALVVEGV